MRKILVEDGLTLRFPGRGVDFIEGVEIGVLASMMALGAEGITRPIGRTNLEQARALAEGMGYRLIVAGEDCDEVAVTLTRRTLRPALRVIAGGR